MRKAKTPMDMAGFLPAQRRTGPEEAKHLAGIASVAETLPVIPVEDGLVLCAVIGHAEVLPCLVALKSVWLRLRRGRVVIVDDGTLNAQDRTLLAQHFGDPAILRGDAAPFGPFPHNPQWARLLAALDGRLAEYWLLVDCDTVTLDSLDEVGRALSSNRSCFMPGGPDVPAEPLSLAEFAARRSSISTSVPYHRMQLENLLARLKGEKRWRYLRGGGGLLGFAAGNYGRDLAGALMRRLEVLAGEEFVAETEVGDAVADFLLANEGEPVCLPHARYRNWRGEDTAEAATGDTALLRFDGAQRYERGAFTACSLRAIEALAR